MSDFQELYQIKCAMDRVESALDTISTVMTDGQGNVLQIVKLLENLENLNIKGKRTDWGRTESLPVELRASPSAGCAEYTAPYRLNGARDVAVSNTYQMSNLMADCPKGVKVLLLGAGGVLVIGQYAGEWFWQEWCALPRRAD